METNQSSTNQNLAGAEVQPRQANSNNRLFVGIIISVLLTAITSSTAVYFWQKSTNEEEISSMEQKIASLEKQVSTMKEIKTPPQQPSSPAPSPSTISDKTANWKPYTFQPLQLSLKVPPELIVHSEEPNPGNDFTAYIQNYAFNTPSPKEDAYQLYIVWQKIPTVTQTEFQLLKDDLDANTVEDTMISGYPAIKGQVKGIRNRFVTYILKGNTKISLFTSEPTQINKELTDQILSTFKFIN